MNIAVAMKQIPDLQQVRFKDRKPIFDNVPYTFSSIDKNALEAAVLIKEATESRVTVISVGNSELSDTVKEALAAGADDAQLIEKEDYSDSVENAALIAGLVKKSADIDLLIFGEGSGDNYTSQVSSRAACLLGWPQVGFVNEISVSDGKAVVTRSLENSTESIEIQLPAVISVVAGLNEPRIPSVSQILRAGRKDKTVTDAASFGISVEKTVETVSNLAPIMERKQIHVKNVSELLATLKNEGLLEG